VLLQLLMKHILGNTIGQSSNKQLDPFLSEIAIIRLTIRYHRRGRGGCDFACGAPAKALNDGSNKGSAPPDQFHTKIFEVFFAEIHDGPTIYFVAHECILKLTETLFLEPKRNLLFRPRARHLGKEGAH
jgi:hypothetical protein